VPVVIGLGVAITMTLLVGMATYLSTRQILRGEPAEGMRYE
jgi:ABC-type lipoprotein release transport system permease subunit